MCSLNKASITPEVQRHVGIKSLQTSMVNPDFCAVICSKCGVKVTRSTYLAYLLDITEVISDIPMVILILK
jgi:hypothetical protein